MMRILKFIFLLIFLGLSFLAIGIYSLHFSKYNIGDSKLFLVEPGQPMGLVIDKLEEDDLIMDSRMIDIMVKLHNLSYEIFQYSPFKDLPYPLTFKVGEYMFDGDLSAYDVIKKISLGDVYYRKFVVKDGMTNQEIYSLLMSLESLEGDVDMSLYAEGSFLPDTYYYVKSDTVLNQIKLMKKQMDNFLDIIWQNRDKSLPFKDKRDLLILASIVEKEASKIKDKELVASVFINRLKKGMKLQSDATSIYGITLGKYKLGTIKRSHLNAFNPHNTYAIKGFPKTPISNPSKSSIIAAANHKKTDYYYFVGEGELKFSRDLKQHNQNVKEYRALKNLVKDNIKSTK